MNLKDYQEEKELVRQKLWCDIAVAYVQASNSVSKEGAADWADFLLDAFDKRFEIE